MSHSARRPQAGLSLRSLLVSLAALGALALTGAPSHSAVSARADDLAAPAAAQRFAALPLLRQQAQDEGTVRVIVKLDASFTPEGKLRTEAKVEEQQQEIEQVLQELLESLPPMDAEAAPVETFESIPYVVLEVDTATLEALAEHPAVADIQQDGLSQPLLAESIPIIGADDAWAAGYTGAGQVIAILDTGIDKNHPFLSGKVVGEACFSRTDSDYGSTSLCPSPDENGDQIGTDSAVNCPLSIPNCGHGTHVAGIAAGNGAASGVAKNANIVAIQVFSRFDGSYCPMGSPCLLSYTSDQLAALDWLYSQKDSYNLAAANLSLGSTQVYSSACDNDSRKAAIDNLRSVGIATVVAAGNSGSRNSLSSPACISSAVSVGATTDSAAVASYSNVAPFLSLLAPGSSIRSSVPNDAFQTMSGTSMAAPHVAGAFAVLKALKPDATVDQLLAALDSTGQLITIIEDGSTAGPFKRIQLKAAADALVPPPASSFEDVPTDYWAYPYIEALYQNGFVAGCSATPRLYCPQNVLNRAESAVFVERGAHGALPAPPYAPPPTATFSDVLSSFWGYGWIESLWQDGFTAGCNTNPLAYCPEQQHTRAEGSVFFLRIKNGTAYAPPTPAGIFTDVAPTAWYAGWVEAAYNQGLLPACSESPLQFCPEGALDRSWAAYMMVQAKGGLAALGAETP